MNSIEQCIVERANHKQVLQNGLKRLNERELQTQTCKVQEVQASNDSSGDKDCSRIVSDKRNDQGLENQSNTSGDESMETGDSNVIPDSPDMCDNDIQNDQNVVECDDEHVALANLISNLKLDVGKNKKIQKQLKKANTILAQELKECKYILVETSRTLRESNSIRDSCLVALQTNELQHYEQSECISNVIPDSLDMCDNDIQNDKNNVECDDERVALANLIANLKLDVDENKKIQRQLKKANTTLAQELKECKTILAETSKTLGESNSIRDSCLVALQISKSISKSRQAYNVMTNNINYFRELIDQAWEKHSMDHLALRALTAHDMQILIKTCLMPLALKTQNDSLAFVHELKKEMHADLKFVESLEKEINELEYDKAEFSNMYDTLLQEYVSNDVMCSYLHSLSDLDAHTDPYDVTAPGPSSKSQKHVSFKTPREFVGSNDMVYNYYLEEAKKKAQIQNDNTLNTKLDTDPDITSQVEDNLESTNKGG
nr:hypothetical protein [Tanacetum cinerariifolium]